MVKTSRKTAIKQLNDLKRIEDLLASTKQQDNPKEQLIQKAKQMQKELKENAPEIKYLKYPHKEVKVSDINVSEHCYKRADERFGLTNISKEKAIQFIKDHLAQAKYIGQVTSEDETEAHMFVEGRIVFHVTLDFKVIKTIIKLENKVKCSVAHSKVTELLHKEFRKLDRKEKATIRKLEEYKIDSAVEIAELKRRIHRTKSTPVKLSCKGRIKALEDNLTELENSIIEIRKLKRSAAYTCASVI